MELFKLFGTVLIEDKEGIEALKNVDKKGDDSGKKLNDIANKGLAIGSAIVAGAGAAVTGLMALANGTADTADKWDKLSLRTGIAVEELQRWGYAAGQSGADITVLETGMKKLSASMIDAQSGSANAKSAYEALGISMADLATMSPEETFDSVMNKLAEMPESAEKNVVGNQLLGKSYTELKPLLAEGSEGMQALKDRADELGIVMSEDAVSSGVVFGDTLADAKASLDGVKNGIMSELMPKLTEMLEWFLSKMPEIKKFASDTFDKIAVVITVITDNINIILPVLGLFFTAMVAMKIISTISNLITAWSTVTKVASGIQVAFNAVMAANPIAIVILAIVALIATGVLLWKNWDKIKEFAQQLWDKIKNVFGGIKDVVTEKVDAIKSKLTDVFGKIKDIMSKPFESARDIIKTVIDKIKGFLNFNWEFPKLKMPHFSVTGSMNPLKWIDEGLPKIGVEWYAKGGIFSKPTLFNTPYGLKGVGDAKSPEVVAPLHELNNMIESGINRAIAPLLMNLSQGESLIVENTIYFGDDKVWKAAKRGKLREERRYEVQAEF